MNYKKFNHGTRGVAYSVYKATLDEVEKLQEELYEKYDIVEKDVFIGFDNICHGYFLCK